jgi:hypothetical protein
VERTLVRCWKVQTNPPKEIVLVSMAVMIRTDHRKNSDDKDDDHG